MFDLSYNPEKANNNLIFNRVAVGYILSLAFNIRLCSNEGEKLKKYSNVSLDCFLFLVVRLGAR